MQLPSDKDSSTPIEALVGPKAFAYEIKAYQMIAMLNELEKDSFAFCGARMPLELLTHKDSNGILSIECHEHYTDMRFTVPVKPVFYDIDVASEVDTVKARLERFATSSELSKIEQISSLVDGIHLGFSRYEIGKAIKATLYYYPKAAKTRILSTTHDLVDDEDGFYRPMGHVSTRATQSFEVLYSNMIVKDSVTDWKKLEEVLSNFFYALRKMRITPRHVESVASMLNVAVDVAKTNVTYEKPKTPADEVTTQPAPTTVAATTYPAPTPVAASPAPTQPVASAKGAPGPKTKPIAIVQAPPPACGSIMEDEDRVSEDEDDEEYDEEESEASEAEVKPKAGSKRPPPPIKRKVGRPRRDEANV